MKLYVVMDENGPWEGRNSGSYRRPHVRAFTSEASAKKSIAAGKAQRRYGWTPPTHVAEFILVEDEERN